MASIAFITWRDRRRAQRLARTAGSLGLTYLRDGTPLLNDGLADLPLFMLAAVSRRGAVSNVIAGQVDGVSVTACDYAYWTGSTGSDRFDYAQTVACFRLEPDRYPSFTVYPAGSRVQQASLKLALGSAEVLTAIARPLGSKDGRWNAMERVLEGEQQEDVAIGASPEFSARYHLRGPDRERMQRVIRADALESLVDDDPRPLSVECSGRWLAIYRKNHKVDPADMLTFLRRSVDLKKRLFV